MPFRPTPVLIFGVALLAACGRVDDTPDDAEGAAEGESSGGSGGTREKAPSSGGSSGGASKDTGGVSSGGTSSSGTGGGVETPSGTQELLEKYEPGDELSFEPGMGEFTDSYPSGFIILVGSPDTGVHAKAGNWFAANGDAELVELDPRGDKGAEGYHFAGDSPEILWAQLDHPSTGLVDLSLYSGMSFWASSAIEGGRIDVYWNALGQALWDEGAGELVEEISLKDGWQRFEFSFTDWGVDVSLARSIDFVFRASEDTAEFDIAIDDLSFICGPNCSP